MATVRPEPYKTCDWCKEKIEPGDELLVNRFQFSDKNGRVIVEAFFPLKDYHTACAAKLLLCPLEDWEGAPRTRAAKLDTPNVTSQPAPDAPKRSRKGKDEQAD